MIPNEDQFDDFKVPETAAYVNDAIGRVFEKELTEVEQFKDDLCATGYRFIGFLCTETEYNNCNNLLKEKRYQPYKPLRRMESVDGVVFFVNTQWTQESMKKIVKLAKEEGMEVETKNKL